MGAEVGSTANSYQVLAKLAMGGMAEIFLARGANTTGVERYVVLKRILREKANDTQFVQMFLEEARLAAQLQHANIAQVYDIGKLGDSYFFTMEYVHGETVRSLLERSSQKQRDIPVSAVLSVIAGSAAGLQHAHERIGVGGHPLNIVHRDISPSNLMVSYEGIVKVVDFGVAKATTSATETRTGTVKGKAAYMSPEQARGEQLDRRSDLFSLGIVAWEMLTTRRLFTGSTDFDIMTSIVRKDVPPPSSVRAGIPRQLDELVLRLLAKNTRDRYQCGDDVVEALESVATDMGHQLSQKALGRYIREVFGTRPEPWVELASSNDALESVSVTSEPIPADIAAGLSYSDLAVMDGLQDFTVRDGAPSVTPTPPTPTPIPNLRGNADLDDDLDAPTVAVESLRDVAPTLDRLAAVPTLKLRKLDYATPVGGSPAITAGPSPALASAHKQTIFGVSPSHPALADVPLPVTQPLVAQAPQVPVQPMQLQRPVQPPVQPMGMPVPQPPPLGAQPQRMMPQPIIMLAPTPVPAAKKPSALWFVLVGLAVIGAAVASFALVR
jgi:serine/threonine protein kinase